MHASIMSSTVDFEQDGIQHGHLVMPHSDNSAAWGSVMTPITVIKNGTGPTALLTGGNHGDEYEGITALTKLALRLKPEQVQGRVLVIPAMNAAAVRAATRTSPLDQVNMNRAFPGDPSGSVTLRIADYFQRTLIPLCNYALDIHSGGKTLNFLPFAAAHRLPDSTQEARCFAAAKAFGAPNTVLMVDLEANALYDTAVESQGKVFVTTELCGGGTSTPESIALAENGVDNFLHFCGITATPAEVNSAATRVLEMPNDHGFIISQHSGLLEFCVALGDHVKAGQTLAKIYTLNCTGEQPQHYKAQISGVVIGRHFPALISLGDTLAVLAVEAVE